MRKLPITMEQAIAAALAVLIWLFIPFAATAQDAASSPPSSDYVSRAEYDKLKAEHEAMKQEMEALKTTVRQMANGMAPAAPAEGPSTAKATAPKGKQVAAGATSQTGTPSTAVEAASTETSGPLATHSFS